MENIGPGPYAQSDELEKKRKKKRLIIGVILGFVLLAIVGCIFAGSLAKKMASSMDEAVEVLEEFMQAMSEKNIDGAFELLTEEARQETSLSDLKDLVSGLDYVLYDGFQEITIQNVKQTTNTSSGTFQRMNGIVKYEDGFTGEFSAIIYLENGQWKIQHVNVTVPPAKVEKFLEKNGN